jgi:hypothetical protein
MASWTSSRDENDRIDHDNDKNHDNNIDSDNSYNNKYDSNSNDYGSTATATIRRTASLTAIRITTAPIRIKITSG